MFHAGPLMLRYMCQVTFQLLLFCTAKLVFGFFTKRTIHSPSPKLKRRSLIIVANHQRALDPFIIISALPFSIAAKLLPIGFMTANIFYDSALRPFCWLSGCFPARNPKGKHKIFGVEGSSTLLRHGFSIFIFPEGTRVKNGARGPAHTGVVRIHQSQPTTPLLLCHITRNTGWRAALSGKRFVIRYKVAQQPAYYSPDHIMDELFAP